MLFYCAKNSIIWLCDAILHFAILKEKTWLYERRGYLPLVSAAQDKHEKAEGNHG